MSMRDVLLATTRRRYVVCDVPGVGNVRMQSISEADRAKIEQVAAQDITRMRAQLLALTLVDDTGARLFADNEIDAILAMDSRVTNELSSRAMEHVGTQDTTEETVKNLQKTHDDAPQ